MGLGCLALDLHSEDAEKDDLNSGAGRIPVRGDDTPSWEPLPEQKHVEAALTSRGNHAHNDRQAEGAAMRDSRTSGNDAKERKKMWRHAACTEACTQQETA